jgi:hypothetical protein
MWDGYDLKGRFTSGLSVLVTVRHRGRDYFARWGDGFDPPTTLDPARRYQAVVRYQQYLWDNRYPGEEWVVLEIRDGDRVIWQREGDGDPDSATGASDE